MNAIGVLAPSRKARRQIADWTWSRWPEIRQRRRAFADFKAAHAGSLSGDALHAAGTGRDKVLLISTSSRPLEAEVWLTRALLTAGLTPVVLFQWGRRHLRDYHRLAGASETCLWNDFHDDLTLDEAAEETVDALGSIENLLGYAYAGARVGRIAVSSSMHDLRTGSLDLAHSGTRIFVARQLANAMYAAVAAQRIVARLRPAAAIVADFDYTPLGSMFDVCLAHGIDVVSYDAAHRSNALLFKRHRLESIGEHRASLSAPSWKKMQEMPWSDGMANRLQREFAHGYETRQWYGQAATQFRHCHRGKDELRDLLGLDPGKKNAFIFPHISWDAPFAWGTHLFRDFDDWLIETVKAARLNDRVNWIVKFHPANLKKSALGENRIEPAESRALRKHLGDLPPHIFIMPADGTVSTHSAFALMDYCLTVRGTVGIEAAARGIPVLTGGGGRYDRRGFTIDSDSPGQYLERIANIEKTPPLTAGQERLAQRYAYGLFILRPLRLTSLSLQFSPGESEIGWRSVRSECRIMARTGQDWCAAADIKALANWLNDPAQIDFLAPDQ